MTGIQWAVLQAYARTLGGLERRRLLRACELAAPPLIGQRLARTVAEKQGLTCRGRITPHGTAAARRFLALHAERS